jgi:Peptidase S46
LRSPAFATYHSPSPVFFQVNPLNRRIKLPCLALILALSTASAFADEGMWLFNAFPTARVKARYKYTVTQPFLDHLRLSSVHMGASASFVSPDGLVFTNHHVGAGCVHNLSTATHDYIKDGFYAPTRDQEPRCPGIEVQNLIDIRDITKDVQQSVRPKMTDAEAGSAQRAAMSRLESECADPAKNIRCETVTLYSGGLYHLYKYKKYTDVRLVMAPEFDAAFFGGDPDNFTYPRYDLDITFFRVYENGKPIHVDNYLPFTTSGVKEGDLVFISGHPGSTGRLLTESQLAFLRDVNYPARLKQLKQNIDALLAFSAESPENARAAERVLFGSQNSYKAVTGYNSGLTDPATMARKRAEEDKLRKDVAANPKLKDSANAWNEIAAAMQWQRENFKRVYWQSDMAIPGQFANYARMLVRLATELPKPNDKRLREYQDQNIPSREQALASTAPLSRPLEIRQITVALAALQENLGADSDFVKQVLAGKSPAARAAELINGSHLDDPAFRRELYKGGHIAIDVAADPMIVLLKQIDPLVRTNRKDSEDHVESVVRRNGALIAKARFELEGTASAPDATGTLRLSYGTIKGYVENGKKIPYFTTFADAFKHEAEHEAKPPYVLPASYHRAKDKLTLDTVLDTADTGDSIGGNSGSPVVNTKGEIIGILFDGNIQSLPWNFQFDDQVGRSVLTDSRAVIEALRKIYNALPLADELIPPVAH